MRPNRDEPLHCGAAGISSMGNVTTVYVPRDSAAISVGADEVAVAIATSAAAAGREINLVRNGSRGMLWLEPLVEFETGHGRVAYGPVAADEVDDLIRAGMLDGAETDHSLGPTDEHEWLRDQRRVTFARVGVIDPLSVEDYEAHGGLRGLRNALAMPPEQIVEEIIGSGLRGRGGAGFPAGIKWKTVLGARADVKFVCCNADEGDSGTFADRMLMEGDPFTLIEGMTIAADATACGPVRPPDRGQQRAHARLGADDPGRRRVRVPGVRRRPVPRHTGVPARRQHRARRHRRAAVRGHAQRVGQRVRRRHPHRPAGPRGAGRRAAWRVPAGRPVRPQAGLRGVRRGGRYGRPWRHRGVRRHRRHGADGPLRHGVLRCGVVRQVHAVPRRRGPRPRDHRQDHLGRGCRSEPGRARRPVRADDRRLTVRDGRPDPHARPQRRPALPRRLRPKLAERAVRHSGRELAMGLLKEPDLGTPARKGEATVEVEIDGLPVKVPEDTSVMRAAALAGVDVPKLCATDSLEAFGSCRLCLVEIDGVKGTPASCTTPVRPGMTVRTQSPKLEKLRRGVMELYISDHPLDCLTCSANGDCELQDMAGVVGLREVRYGVGTGENHLDAPTDTSNPYFDFDESKCIVCSRCVRACDEVQGTFALTIEGRGFDSKVSPGGLSFLDSECVSCGACVQACPTATLEERAVVDLGMPNRSVITTCAYCGVGCSFKAELKGDELIRMVPYKDGGANEGHSCGKGRFAV